MDNIEAKLDNYLKNQNIEKNQTTKQDDFLEVKDKDGIVERVNLKVIVEDGRQILMD